MLKRVARAFIICARVIGNAAQKAEAAGTERASIAVSPLGFCAKSYKLNEEKHVILRLFIATNRLSFIGFSIFDLYSIPGISLSYFRLCF